MLELLPRRCHYRYRWSSYSSKNKVPAPYDVYQIKPK